MDAWRQLLARAVGYLDGIGAGRRDWRLGGGTLLMIRYEHRHSQDIDIFLSDPQYLSYLSPRLNDRTAQAVKGYSEAASSLRLELPEGEIDYLVTAPVFPKLSPEWLVQTGDMGDSVRGHG